MGLLGDIAEISDTRKEACIPGVRSVVVNSSTLRLGLSRIKVLWGLLALVMTISCHIEDQRPWWPVEMLPELLQAKPGPWQP